MAGGPRAGLLTHFYEKGERQLGAFFAAAFDSAQSAAFDSVCCCVVLFTDDQLDDRFDDVHNNIRAASNLPAAERSWRDRRQ